MIAVLLILIPLLTGLVAFLIKSERSVRSWALFSSMVTMVISLLGLAVLKDAKYLAFQADWMAALNSSFSVKLDGLGQVLCLLNAVAFPIILIATWRSQYKNAHNFFALMLLTQAGMMGVFLSMDALLFYFFWELALIPAYFLCSQWGGPKRIQVTFKFFIYTFIGSLLMLIGLLYIYFHTKDNSFSIASFLFSYAERQRTDLAFLDVICCFRYQDAHLSFSYMAAGHVRTISHSDNHGTEWRDGENGCIRIIEMVIACSSPGFLFMG